jgi:hypothetical protein
MPQVTNSFRQVVCAYNNNNNNSNSSSSMQSQRHTVHIMWVCQTLLVPHSRVAPLIVLSAPAVPAYPVRLSRAAASNRPMQQQAAVAQPLQIHSLHRLHCLLHEMTLFLIMRYSPLDLARA